MSVAAAERGSHVCRLRCILGSVVQKRGSELRSGANMTERRVVFLYFRKNACPFASTFFYFPSREASFFFFISFKAYKLYFLPFLMFYFYGRKLFLFFSLFKRDKFLFCFLCLLPFRRQLLLVFFAFVILIYFF